MSRGQRQTFASILIIIIIFLLGMLQDTKGFIGIIIGILGLVFFFVGVELINYFVVESPESEENRIINKYEEKLEKIKEEYAKKQDKPVNEYKEKKKKSRKQLDNN